MGLEIIISEQSDFRTNDKGQRVYTVTEIGDLAYCYSFFHRLDARFDGMLPNGATVCVYEGTILAILDELKENNSEDIEKVEKFVKENNLKKEEPPKEIASYYSDEIGMRYEDYGRTFEIYTNW